MSRLDRELEQAVSDSEAEAGGRAPETLDVPPVSAGRGAPEGPAEPRKWGLLVALLAVAGGILGLVFTSAEGAAIYSVSVDELARDQAKFEGRSLRVQGMLVKGSLRHRAEPCEYRFSIEKNEKVLPVRYEECVVPDTFKDVPGVDVEVTAEGKLTEAGHFQATQIMAKCPSKYEMQQKAAKGEAAPHEMLEPNANLPPIVD